MKASRVFTGLAVLSLVLVGATAGWAQTDYERKAEEWNAYQDILRTQDAKERLQAIEKFFQSYPDTQYKPYLFPVYVETAYAAGNYAQTIKVADEFLAIPREEVLESYRQSKPDLEASALDGMYYRFDLLYVLAFLQSRLPNGPEGDKVAAKVAERSEEALAMHRRLYASAQPPQGVSPQQFEQIKQQEEASLHTALAAVSWRQKNYLRSAREFDWLLQRAPEDPAINYRLGLSYLQKEPREQTKGLWYVARAIAFGIPKGDDVKGFLTQNVAAYQNVPAGCVERAGQVNKLIEAARQRSAPPMELPIVPPATIKAVREELNVKRIFDELQAGGEGEEVIWLASCGLELPPVPGKIIEIAQNPDNLVTLRVASTQEAADANIANVEVKVTEATDVSKLKQGNVISYSGILMDYQKEPQFLLKLTEGRVLPEENP